MTCLHDGAGSSKTVRTGWVELAVLLLVAMPGDPSSVLAPSSKARSPSSVLALLLGRLLAQKPVAVAAKVGGP